MNDSNNASSVVVIAEQNCNNNYKRWTCTTNQASKLSERPRQSFCDDDQLHEHERQDLVCGPSSKFAV